MASYEIIYVPSFKGTGIEAFKQHKSFCFRNWWGCNVGVTDRMYL
jgi:hypothetical protein